jgi:glycosyl hydrolase family 36
MPGILGLTYRSSDLTEADFENLSHEIGIYKRLRDEIVSDGSGALLTPQANPQDPPPWDAVQEVSSGNGTAAVFAYQNDGGTPSVTLPLSGLQQNTVYTISTADGEPLGSMTGAELMNDGLEVDESFESAARVLILRPAGAVTASVDRAQGNEQADEQRLKQTRHDQDPLLDAFRRHRSRQHEHGEQH